MWTHMVIALENPEWFTTRICLWCGEVYGGKRPYLCRECDNGTIQVVEEWKGETVGDYGYTVE